MTEETTNLDSKPAGIDLEAKRQELLDLWQDVFSLTRGIVDKAKSGEVVLKASMLKEVVGFLRLCNETIKELEALEKARLKAVEVVEDEETGEKKEVPTFGGLTRQELESLEWNQEPFKTE